MHRDRCKKKGKNENINQKQSFLKIKHHSLTKK
jgi:hypothetical protein